MNIHPNDFDEAFHRFQIRTRREIELYTKLLTDLHPFWKVDQQPPLTGIEGPARLTKRRFHPGVLDRQVDVESRMFSPLKIDDSDPRFGFVLLDFS